jgi:hypothetical protein
MDVVAVLTSGNVDRITARRGTVRVADRRTGCRRDEAIVARVRARRRDVAIGRPNGAGGGRLPRRRPLYRRSHEIDSWRSPSIRGHSGDISQIDGAHPRLGAWLPPVWPRRQGFSAPRARESTVVTPATGFGQPADGFPGDRGSPLPHSGRTSTPDSSPPRSSSVSMGPGLEAAASRSGPGCRRTARAARRPPPSGRSRNGRGQIADMKGRRRCRLHTRVRR